MLKYNLKPFVSYVRYAVQKISKVKVPILLLQRVPSILKHTISVCFAGFEWLYRHCLNRRGIGAHLKCKYGRSRQLINTPVIEIPTWNLFLSLPRLIAPLGKSLCNTLCRNAKAATCLECSHTGPRGGAAKYNGRWINPHIRGNNSVLTDPPNSARDLRLKRSDILTDCVTVVTDWGDLYQTGGTWQQTISPSGGAITGSAFPQRKTRALLTLVVFW